MQIFVFAFLCRYLRLVRRQPDRTLLHGLSGSAALGWIVCLNLVSKPLCSSKKKLFIIYGKWTECLWGIDPVAYESFRKQERRGEPPRKSQMVRHCLAPAPLLPRSCSAPALLLPCSCMVLALLLPSSCPAPSCSCPALAQLLPGSCPAPARSCPAPGIAWQRLREPTVTPSRALWEDDTQNPPVSEAAISGPLSWEGLSALLQRGGPGPCVSTSVCPPSQTR